MRKKIFLLAFLFILVILVCLIPFIDGFLFKSNYLKFIASIQASEYKPIKIEVQNYDMGWLHSTIKLHITFKNPQRYYPNGLIFDEEISHGPIVYDPSTKGFKFALALLTNKFYASPELNKLFTGFNTNQPLLQINALAHFDGSWHHDLIVAPFTITNVGTLTIQNTSDDTNISTEHDVIKEINANGTIGQITFKADMNNAKMPNITVQPLSFKQDMMRNSTGTWNVNSEISTSNISVQGQDGSQFSINQAEIVSSRGLGQNDLYNTSVIFTASDIENPHDIFLPKMSAIKFNLAINNLSPAGMKKYADFVNGLMNANNQLQPGAYEQQMQNMLANILTPSSNAMIDLMLNSPSGALSFNAKLGLKPGAPATITLPDIISNASAENNMRIAAPLLTNIVSQGFSTVYTQLANIMKAKMAAQPAQAAAYANLLAIPTTQQISDKAKNEIASWVQQGLLVADQNDYTMNVTADGPTIKINGKDLSSVMSPSGMPGSVMPMPATSTLPATMSPPASPMPGMIMTPLPSAPATAPIPAKPSITTSTSGNTAAMPSSTMQGLSMPMANRPAVTTAPPVPSETVPAYSVPVSMPAAMPAMPIVSMPMNPSILTPDVQVYPAADPGSVPDEIWGPVPIFMPAPEQQ